MFGIKVLILSFGLKAVAAESCSGLYQDTCSEGEICRNDVCEEAVYCGSDTDLCAAFSGLFCVLNYCQPNPCGITIGCVHGQVCSRDGVSRCVYPVSISVQELSEVTLAFKEPATPGNYEEILWYKGGRDNLDRVAVIHPVITGNKTSYYGDLCSDNSSCRTSDRAHLNADTGELKIHSVKLADEGFYYYEFYVGDDVPDTGVKYQYLLYAYVIPTTLTIEGVPSEYIEVGTNLTLTCTVDRIKPLASDMYWVVHGRNDTRPLFISWLDGDMAFIQSITYRHTVTKEDKNVPITCVIVPVYGDPVEVKKFIKPGYAPLERPRVEVSENDHYKGEKVTLTCVENGNPPCNTYVWKRLEGNINFTPETQIYTFIMNQLNAGNYTCQCSNLFGSSLDSEIKEITYLGNERPETEPEQEEQKDNGGLIAGCVIGVLVLVALVVVAVFFCKTYRCNIHIQSRNDPTADKGHQEMDGYENPVNNSVNPVNNSEYEELSVPPTNKPEDRPNEYHYIDDQRENPVTKSVKPVNNSEYEELSVPPTNEPENIPNEYQYIDDQEENQVNSNVNPEPENRPNEYHYIDVGAMDRTGVDGYMNPAITTYGDGL